MNGKHGSRFYPAEAALLIALSVTLLIGVMAQSRQRQLALRVVRLHVIASSDSEEDQAVKLRVRDAILEELAPALKGVTTEAEALEILTLRLEELAELSRAVSGTRATVTLGQETYPTREYDSFSLPAGRYASLRVVLGEGEGHNWWCVVYPPLCTAVATEDVQSVSNLPREDVKLITGDGEGYVIRFRIIEWWEQLFARAEND